MNLSIYLPIAANSVNILLLLGLGGLVGFLSGLFGVGGGFLLTPLLIMFGIPPTVAAASDSNQIVAASASGTYAHYRLGNVDFKMGVVLLVGGVLGGSLGVYLVRMLRAMGNADFVIKITYVAMLGIIGGYMFVESLQSLKKTPSAEKPSDASPKKPSLYARLITTLPFKIHFSRVRDQDFPDCSPPAGKFGGNPGRHHGRRGRIYHGSDHGLFTPHAHARGRGNQPLSDIFHLYQCDRHAGPG